MLPRRHQDGRGRDRGFHVQAQAGAYARIPVWHGREHFLLVAVPVAYAVIRPALVGSGVALPVVSLATFSLWARTESLYAQDQRTGRRLIVRPDVVASLMDMTERTVQRCRALARALGLLVDVFTGRMLTFAERRHAQARGSRQRGLSTESALTVPRAAVGSVGIVTPSGGDTSGIEISPDTWLSDRCAVTTDATPSRHPDEKGTRKRRRAPSAAVQLARSVRQAVPWTAAEAPGVLAGALARFAAAEPPWSGADVAAAIAATDARMGWSPVNIRSIKTRPVAVLAAYLRHLDVHADHPCADLGFPSDDESVDLTPCDREDCDHGWLTITQDGRDVGAKCPDCPPGIRTARTL